MCLGGEYVRPKGGEQAQMDWCLGFDLCLQKGGNYHVVAYPFYLLYIKCKVQKSN